MIPLLSLIKQRSVFKKQKDTKDGYLKKYKFQIPSSILKYHQIQVGVTFEISLYVVLK